MHDIIHGPDDETVEHHLGPGEEASVSFNPDPKIGDAGADLADDFGRSYLQSVTTGDDMSEEFEDLGDAESEMDLGIDSDLVTDESPSDPGYGQRYLHPARASGEALPGRTGPRASADGGNPAARGGKNRE